MTPFKHILVICIGNICRSPMAEKLLSVALGDSVQVSSAGLGALVGQPADAMAQTLMNELGLPINTHCARQISLVAVNQADLIFVMTKRQKQEVETLFPAARGRVFMMTHWSGEDVADPYKLDRIAFQQSLSLIQKGIAAWLPHLRLPAASDTST